jgi:NAD(P)H dehydrogenase (quinone)
MRWRKPSFDLPQRLPVWNANNEGMKHVVILAHPAAESFNSSVAKTYALAARGLGHEVLVRDLYAMKFDPCLQAGELPVAESFGPGIDVVAERALIGDADAYILVYPLWLNSPPAILKGYLERVFGFGFAYGRNGQGPEPLLRGKRLISFTTSGAPLYWLKETGAFEAIQTLFDRHFSEMCGLFLVDHVHFGGIVPGIRPDAVARMMEEVGNNVRKQFGRVQ